MRQIWGCDLSYVIPSGGLGNAADQTQKEEAAKGKAEVLEEKASAKGSKTLPTPAEIITKPQAQSVDPAGEEPLDDAITCLAALSTGRPIARIIPRWKPSPMSL